MPEGVLVELLLLGEERPRMPGVGLDFDWKWREMALLIGVRPAGPASGKPAG